MFLTLGEQMNFHLTEKMWFSVKNIHTVYRHASENICTVHVYFSMLLHHICTIYMNFNSWISSLFQCFCHIMTFLVSDEKYGSSSHRGGLLVYFNWLVGRLIIVLPSYCQCWGNRPVHSMCFHGYMSIMADTHRMERPSRRLLTSRAFNVSALLITNW